MEKEIKPEDLHDEFLDRFALSIKENIMDGVKLGVPVSKLLHICYLGLTYNYEMISDSPEEKERVIDEYMILMKAKLKI